MRLRLWLQHVTNPLHIYCRLLDFGLGLRWAKRLGSFYERHVYSFRLRELQQKCGSKIKRF